LATNEDLEKVFDDCMRGAVPPLGPAYGIESIWDDNLMSEPDLMSNKARAGGSRRASRFAALL
jgi:prolyl-tRNA editing enzyme YbaK/EbsC (Cys-tRNA(Pro) deacylase)